MHSRCSWRRPERADGHVQRQCGPRRNGSREQHRDRGHAEVVPARLVYRRRSVAVGRRRRLGRRLDPHDVLARERRHDHGPEPHLCRRSRDANRHGQGHRQGRRRHWQATFTVTVSNVAPTATLANNGPINEGSSATVSFSSQSDPRAADTTAGFHYASAAPAATSRARLRRAGDHRVDQLHLRRRPGAFTVTARIIDKDDGFTEYTTVGHRQQRRADGDLRQQRPGQRGLARRRSASPASPTRRADTTAGFHYAYQLPNGDLSRRDLRRLGDHASTTCTFDDNGSYTVKAPDHRQGRRLQRVHDRRSRSTTSPRPRHHRRTGPSPRGHADQSRLSGLPIPSTADTTAGFTYAWLRRRRTATRLRDRLPASFAFTPDDNGPYVVSLTATDKDGGVGRRTDDDHRHQRRPDRDVLGNNGPINEGGSATVASAAQSDPSTGRHDRRLPLRVRLRGWLADGRDVRGFRHDRPRHPARSPCRVTHVVSGRIIDKDGGFNDYTTTVVVNDVAPTIDVTKTAAPTHVNEPSGGVTFTVQIKNTSGTTDPVTVSSVKDAIGLAVPATPAGLACQTRGHDDIHDWSLDPRCRRNDQLHIQPIRKRQRV